MPRKTTLIATLTCLIVGLVCLCAGCGKNEQYKPERFNGFYMTGRYAEALAIAKEDAEDFPESHEAQYNLGQAFCQTLKPAEAIAAFDRAIALEPKHAESYYLKAFCCLATDKEADAQAAFQKALECYQVRVDAAPNPGAMLNCATCLFFLGKRDEALALCDEAIKQNNDNSAHETMAYIQFNNEGLQLYPDFVQRMFDAKDKTWREKKSAEAKALNEKLGLYAKPAETDENEVPPSGGEAGE